jgi:hypothetical protein
MVYAPDTSGTAVGPLRIPQPSANFEGIDAKTVSPPDSSGAAGLTQYVEMVNARFAVFSKVGLPLLGPVNTNTLWAGFGGGCETNNDGDGMILWDSMAQRWLADQFSVSSNPYLLCVAVSATSDATGAWNRYSFQYTYYPDYPKMGVWPDAYYVTLNLQTSVGFAAGTLLCAYDRANMLAGQAATQQCYQPYANRMRTFLPSTLDGTAQPPPGEPNFMVGLADAANTLWYFTFHVDWSDPTKTKVDGPISLGVAPFSQPCSAQFGVCIPQLGTGQQLDSLGDRMMSRLAYRNFGDRESLVVTHSVVGGTSVGARWYELRVSSNGNLSVFQQGTYAPDSAYRWMGSIAMDQSGDIALGYSVSSSSLRPSIRYTGRRPSDPPGQMPQGEATIMSGAGSQTNDTRWGDYTQMSVDPNGCTFWYVNEYLPINGMINWHTRIASFRFNSCDGFLYDQNDSDAGIPISSQDFEPVLDAYDDQAADDFTVPAGQVWAIKKLEVTGQYFNGSGPASSENVFFYQDSGGKPGALIKKVTVSATDHNGSFTIPLNPAVRLGAQTYWVSVQVNLEFYVGGQWGWESREVQSRNKSKWQNPAGGWGFCPSWEDTATCLGYGVPDLMFSLKGLQS